MAEAARRATANSRAAPKGLKSPPRRADTERMNRKDENPSRATRRYLQACRALRAAGVTLPPTRDPRWLLNVAINRRAGWPDDPTHARGSARPTADGRFPPKAGGDYFRTLRLVARELNTPRLIVRPERLGEHRWLVDRIGAERFTTETF